MVEQDDLSRIEQLAQIIRPGCELVRAWRLEGGVSAQVTAFEIAGGGGRVERMVIRRHGAIDKGHNPDIARNEFSLLTLLHQVGLAVPKPVYVDTSGSIFQTPCLVVEWVGGSTAVAPVDEANAINQMAGFLSDLHKMDWSGHDLSFLPSRDDPTSNILRHLPPSPMADRIRDTLAGTDPFAMTNRPVLLHGDFWPGNILWYDNRIAAVIDWEDAAIGDPLADLAGCRIELLWKFGERAMHDFTSHYTAMTGIDGANLPLWELYVSTAAAAHMSRWGLDATTLTDMRLKTGAFMERALAALSSRSGKL